MFQTGNKRRGPKGRGPSYVSPNVSQAGAATGLNYPLEAIPDCKEI